MRKGKILWELTSGWLTKQTCPPMWSCKVHCRMCSYFPQRHRRQWSQLFPLPHMQETRNDRLTCQRVHFQKNFWCWLVFQIRLVKYEQLSSGWIMKCLCQRCRWVQISKILWLPAGLTQAVRGVPLPCTAGALFRVLHCKPIPKCHFAFNRFSLPRTSQESWVLQPVVCVHTQGEAELDCE